MKQLCHTGLEQSQAQGRHRSSVGTGDTERDEEVQASPLEDHFYSRAAQRITIVTSSDVPFLHAKASSLLEMATVALWAMGHLGS